MLISPAYAQSTGGPFGGDLMAFLPMVAIFVVFYFLLIRPQQKRAKEHANLLSNLKKGDQVITRGGVVGRVSGVQDKYVIVEIQEKVRVKVLKSYIDGKEAGEASRSEDSSKGEKKNEAAAS